jgi:drug/metabolite transporter (DMT)-like permease
LKDNERLGLAYALAGFALLSVGDAVIKTLGGEWPPTAVAALRFVFGAVGLGTVLLIREGKGGVLPIPHPAIQLMRGCGLAFGSLSFFSAVFVMPLAEAAALTFTSPMITALLAALFLGEPMRRVTWIASLAAFGGVLIILRPNLAALGWAALLPLVTAFCMSGLMIGNRLVAGKASATTMQFLVAATATPVLLIAAYIGHVSGVKQLALSWPDWTIIARCAFVALSASTAHFLVYMGTTRAGAATIAPMTYVQLLVAAGLGWAVFGERPDAMTLLGAVIIVGAGLFLWNANAPAAGEGEVVP